MLLDFSETDARGRERERENLEGRSGRCSRVKNLGAWGSYHGGECERRQAAAAAAAGCSLPLFSAFMAPVFGKRRKAAFLSHPNAASPCFHAPVQYFFSSPHHSISFIH